MTTMTTTTAAPPADEAVDAQTITGQLIARACGLSGGAAYGAEYLAVVAKIKARHAASKNPPQKKDQT